MSINESMTIALAGLKAELAAERNADRQAVLKGKIVAVKRILAKKL